MSFGELKASLGFTCNGIWHIRWDLCAPPTVVISLSTKTVEANDHRSFHFYKYDGVITTKGRGKRKNNSEKASGHPIMKKPTRSTKKQKVARSTKSTKEKDNPTKQKKTPFDER